MNFRFSSGLKKRILAFISFTVLATSVYLVIDYRGPKYIEIEPFVAFDMPVMKAKDLIVQEFDSSGNLWASRGMIVYKLNKGDNRFERIAHVPTGLNIFWLRNFSILRRFTVRPECIEMVQGKNDAICALSAGRMWYYEPGKKKFFPSLKLEHYGFGDQGARNNGILRSNDSTIYFGEYFHNGDRKNDVSIYESTDNGRTWKKVYTFYAGVIRHIHALQKDPYTGRLWICTGDDDGESMVAYSDDGYHSLVPIGAGSQLWRVCQLIFTEKSVYWGTDNGRSEIAGIYCWDRQTKEIRKLSNVDGAVFFGTSLENGLLVMSTDREGFDIEKDRMTRFWVTDQKYISSISGGTWNHYEPGFKFKFAQLRFQRNQGSSMLAVSVLNQKELVDGDLILVDQNELDLSARNDYEIYLTVQ